MCMKFYASLIRCVKQMRSPLVIKMKGDFNENFISPPQRRTRDAIEEAQSA